MIGVELSVKTLHADLVRHQDLLNRTHAPVPAVLSGTGKGYDIASGEYGAFAISIASVEPYLSGYKVILSIGNLTSATIDSGTISLEWNYKYPYFTGDVNDKDALHAADVANKGWNKNNQTMEVPIQPHLLPGRFNFIEVILPNTKPADLDVIKVTVVPHGISFPRPQ